MNFTPNRVALAAAGTFGIIYVLMVLLVALMPTFYLRMMHSWQHGAMMATPIHVSPASFILGIITFSIAGYAAGFVFTVLLGGTSGSKPA